MRIFDVIKLAFKNLFRRKARTVLTLLGIVVGAVSVIIMISIGLGLDQSKQELLSQFTSLEKITVYRRYDYDDSIGQSIIGNALNDAAVESFKQIENVKAVTPLMDLGSTKLVSGKKVFDWAWIQGMDPEAMPHFEEFDNLKDGGLIPAIDDDEKTIDVILGYNIPYQFYNPKKRGDQESIWNEWYNGEGEDTREMRIDPMNDLIKLTFDHSYGNPPNIDLSGGTTEVTPIKRTKFYNLRVVGYLAFDPDYTTNDTIYMSIEDMKYLEKEYQKYMEQNQSGYYNGNSEEQEYSQVYVKAENMNDVSDIQKKIEEMGYSTSSYMSYVEPLQQKIENDQFLFLAIGCIAFFVAALNIINTMMMSTYERTREIGIMKVLGCRISDIRNLFLLEAGLMGFCGGVIGVPISYVVSYIINYMQAQQSSADMGYYVDPSLVSSGSSIIPIWLCIAAIVFSALVGFISGLYPSIRAMKLSALDAIKNE
ncbi:MAG: ABC transporter permease [Ruminococcaceae bacterium]|nr:ABC transporter permease [Oscillospiraceae bacterium]